MSRGDMQGRKEAIRVWHELDGGISLPFPSPPPTIFSCRLFLFFRKCVTAWSSRAPTVPGSCVRELASTSMMEEGTGPRLRSSARFTSIWKNVYLSFKEG